MRISDWSSDVCSSDLNPGASHANVNQINPASRSIINRRLNAATRRKLKIMSQSANIATRTDLEAAQLPIYLSHRTQYNPSLKFRRPSRLAGCCALLSL